MDGNEIIAAADLDLLRIEKREAELRAEAESLAEQKKAIQIFKEHAIRYLQRQIPGLESPQKDNKIFVAERPKVNNRVSRQGSRSRKISELCRAALINANKPLKISDFLPIIRNSGIEIESKTPSAYLAGILSRDPRFEFRKTVGWLLIIPASSNVSNGDNTQNAQLPNVVKREPRNLSDPKEGWMTETDN